MRDPQGPRAFRHSNFDHAAVPTINGFVSTVVARNDELTLPCQPRGDQHALFARQVGIERP